MTEEERERFERAELENSAAIFPDGRLTFLCELIRKLDSALAVYQAKERETNGRIPETDAGKDRSR